MKHWLVKSEPFKYSWDDLLKDKSTMWDGVRNYAARNNLKEMKRGDLVLFYHSNEGLEIVGIAEVSKEYYPDPTTTEDAWVVVDLKPKASLKKAVSLAALKADERFATLELIRLSRLSVSKVTPTEFKEILKMGNTKI